LPPRAQPRPPREILHVMDALSGVWHMSLGWKAACGLPVPAYWPGVLVACLVATARVQRERRPGAKTCAAILVDHPACCAMASHGTHASVRHALRCVQKRRCAISFALETCLQYGHRKHRGACPCSSLVSRETVHLIQSEGSEYLEVVSPYCTNLGSDAPDT
jgi:hypothetical protein